MACHFLLWMEGAAIMLYSFVQYLCVKPDLNRNTMIWKAVSCLCSYFLCWKIILPDSFLQPGSVIAACVVFCFVLFFPSPPRSPPFVYVLIWFFKLSFQSTTVWICANNAFHVDFSIIHCWYLTTSFLFTVILSSHHLNFLLPSSFCFHCFVSSVNAQDTLSWSFW